MVDVGGFDNYGRGSDIRSGTAYDSGRSGRDRFEDWSFSDRFAAGSVLGMPLGPVGSLLAGIIAGSTAYGDPTGSVDAPLGSVSVGESQTSRAISNAIAAPVVPAVAPAPAPKRSAALEADIKRKRIGRQETILTSRSALTDAPTYKPTLLGQ